MFLERPGVLVVEPVVHHLQHGLRVLARLTVIGMNHHVERCVGRFISCSVGRLVGRPVMNP